MIDPYTEYKARLLYNLLPGAQVRCPSCGELDERPDTVWADLTDGEQSEWMLTVQEYERLSK